MGKDGVVKNIAVVCFGNTQMVRNKSVLETRHLNNPTLVYVLHPKSWTLNFVYRMIIDIIQTVLDRIHF